MTILEIACFNAESAAIACEAGADRIELCHDYHAGGITPSPASVAATIAVANKTNIPVFVMIRPRGGKFIYTSDEFAKMKTELHQLKALGVSGFVFGVLNGDRTVDVLRTKMLVMAAHPLPCTFHRAFDEVADLFGALEDVCETGCAAILSSGGRSTAINGSDVLAKLVKKAGTRLSIIPGGGIRSANVAELQNLTDAHSFHTSALLNNVDLANAREILGMKEKLRATSAVKLARSGVSASLL